MEVRGELHFPAPYHRGKATGTLYTKERVRQGMLRTFWGTANPIDRIGI
jgi:hypothetical protein